MSSGTRFFAFHGNSHGVPSALSHDLSPYERILGNPCWVYDSENTPNPLTQRDTYCKSKLDPTGKPPNESVKVFNRFGNRTDHSLPVNDALQFGDCLPPDRTSLSDVSLKTPAIQIQCFQKDYAIQCCGHGLLSAAAHWLIKLKTHSILLKGKGFSARATIKNNVHWLHFDSTSHPPGRPDPRLQKRLQDYFRELPIQSCFSIGDNNGYAILRFEDNCDLGQLKPPPATLSQDTYRGIICTSRLTGSFADITFRYFAPQYGVPEDSATGSAMLKLIQYWQLPSLTALQRSPAGGLLFGRLNSNSLTSNALSIGGYCSHAT